MSDVDLPDLTELEGVALALVARAGGMTAYAVKEMLAASPSRFWSGSAGAVYPLMKRLTRKGLLTPASTATGRRKATVYQVSESGHHALKAWLADIDRAVDPGIDPLRMRLLFMSLLDADTRAAFMEDVSGRLQRAAAETPFAGGPDSLDNRHHRIWMTARQKAFGKIRN